MTDNTNNIDDTLQTSQYTPIASHEIDYKIHGSDMQFVEIFLDPNETVVAENGSMMYMEQGIQMNTHLGDGSKKNSGIIGSVLGAAKRRMTGENMFLGFFTNKGAGKLCAAFAAPYPGQVIPVDLGALGGSIHCQKGAFLCGARGTSLNLGFTKKLGAGMFGGEGYILQKLMGDGMAFIHAGGSVKTMDLVAGEKIYIDTGSVVGFQSTVGFDITMVKGFKNMVFGGEELFLSTMTGPGRVWIQSMPYSRLIVNMMNTMVDIKVKGKNKNNG